MQSIFGNGGLYITSSGDSVLFPFAFSNIRFEKNNTRQTAITGLVHQTTLYFRPVIECQVILCNQSNVDDFKTLNTLVQNSVFDAITVYPNYDAVNNSSNIGYQCFLDSDIEYLQIDSRVQAGQTIKLKFICKNLITTLPTSISNPVIRTYVDISGDIYVDGSGDKYISVN